MDVKKLGPYVLGIIICELIGAAGTVFTIPAIAAWYAFLNKPPLAPPNWIFGPVWTVIYALMGVAIVRVWLKQKNRQKKGVVLFALQLGLNFLWSFFFFGLRSPLLGLEDIIFLWIAISTTIVVFQKIDKKAAYLMVPYLLWVSFAAWLNYQIVVLN